MSSIEDRNFDDLAQRFEQRIHNSHKGEIRHQVIWRDLLHHYPRLEGLSCPLNILDLGAGLGHFTTTLAKLGHQVTYNDISEVMMQKAQTNAEEQGLNKNIHWHHGAYQTFVKSNKESFDLILSHALLEWLAEPEKLIPSLKQRLKPKGVVSLCFYNPAGLIYHNLLRGNFHAVENNFSSQANSQGFTPNNPVPIEKVMQWLTDSGFTVLSSSGIRVFSDYAPTLRGGLADAEEVLKMELRYSQQAPYKWLARYIHLLVRYQ